MGTDGFDGKIDDARIYNRVLTADEIKRLYKMGNTLRQGAPNSSGSLASGLVGWWTMDGKDTSINNSGVLAVLDRSGNNHTAKSPTAAAAPSSDIGKTGQAVDFNGSSDFISAASALGQTTQRSVSAWIYPRTFGGSDTGAIVGRVGGVIEWAFVLDDANVTDSLQFYQPCDGGADLVAFAQANSIVLNRWTHVAVSWTGGCNTPSVQFYINGSAVPLDGGSSSGLGSPNNDSGDSFSIGDDGVGTFRFNGRMDDMRVYNRALTADEIKRLYNMGR